MQCEICGSQALNGKSIVLDGIEMLVCAECARFGIEKEKPRETQKINFEASQIKKSGEFDSGFDIEKGFGKKTSLARQKQGLTLEELGKKIFEPASLLKRIESESLRPSDKLILKLEKALQIKLREKQQI